MRSAQELQKNLHDLQALLERGTFISLSPEEKDRLLAESLGLSEKLAAVAESSLTIGLLGGTGVGKSSLMNALAGEAIASTSHRRPHTDRVLIYRHEAALLPQSVTMARNPRREITHQADAARHLIICDLPDYDSLLSGHREQVLEFLEHLDLLVWVTTPEKYADAKFYALLREVPKSRENFTFVLNKVDLLFGDEEPGSGYSRLSAVMAGLSRHLSENGISKPVVYAVSAREGCNSMEVSSWNQLENFRRHVFRLRDAKEVKEIKTANLHVELEKLTGSLAGELLTLDILAGVLAESLADLESRRFEWNRTGHETLQRALQEVPREVLDQREPPRALVGIGRGIAAAIRDLRRLSERSDARPDAVDLLLREADLKPMRDELQRAEHRMSYRLLHQGIASEAGYPGTELLDAGGEWQGLLRRMREGAAQHLEGGLAPSFKGFRAVQYGSYAVLFAGLILALTGEAGHAEFLEQPGLKHMAGLLLALIQTVFSSKGFAALGSFLLLQLLLGIRFYGRYKKLLQRHAQKFIESLKLKLERIWEEELDILSEQLTGKAQQVEGQRAALRALRGPDAGD